MPVNRTDAPFLLENNQWFRKTDADTVMVFVHGFFSSSAACWTNKEASTSWPTLVAGDGRFGRLSIFLGGYFTDANSEEYGVRECASQLFRAIGRADEEGTPPPIAYKNIIFVCHSLGGIVTRYLLENNREVFQDKKIGLALIASPSWGSDYADKYSFISSLYKNKVAHELRSGSDLLADLDGRFKDFLELKHADFLGREAIEHHGLLQVKWLPRFRLLSKIPGFTPIVLRQSADRYFSKSRIIPQTNHSSIVKPDSLFHESHTFLVDFYSDFTKKFSIAASSSKKISSDSALLTRGILFDIYSDESEPYYLVRKIDGNLSSNFDVASFWLHGPSGCGKTSIIKRLMSNRQARIVEACFSHCTENNARAQFITELFETLYIRQHGISSIPAASFQGLIQILLDEINKEDSNFVIYIDEVPSGDSANGVENELVSLIEDILLHIKSRTNGNFFRILVSSLSCPSLTSVRHPEKFGGYFYLISCDAWSEKEIGDLANLIIPLLPVEFAELPTSILNGETISPRNLKNFLKLKISQPEWPETKLIEASRSAG
jgi:pimeloyl-ACP methyl ester carboxylesterase